MKIYAKLLLVSLLLGASASAAYTTPRAKYHGTHILSKIILPAQVGQWRAEDVPPGIINLKDPYAASYISDLKSKKYVLPNGNFLYFTLLDAGNFHDPRICFSTSGYTADEMPDTVFHNKTKNLQAFTGFFKKGQGGILLIYWLSLNQKQVGWSRQKLEDLWFALLNKPRVGLVVRLDIPTSGKYVKTSLAMAQNFVDNLSKTLGPIQANYIFGKP